MAKQGARNIWLGVALVVFGVVFLLNNLEVIYVANWWSLILIGMGIAFFLGWLNDRTQTGMLLPAAISLIIGCQFLFLHASWPIYVLAPAVGFWLMYFLGDRDPGLLVPAFILTVIALVFWFQDSALAEFWPVLFIVAGLILIFSDRRKGKKQKQSDAEHVTGFSEGSDDTVS